MHIQPNSFGLYGMAGNVAEWVADVYRPIIDDEANDFNYYRGNLYSKPLIDEDGRVTTVTKENFSDQYEVLPNGRLLIKNMPGDLVQVSLDSLDLIRTNYNSSDNRNFRDGIQNHQDSLIWGMMKVKKCIIHQVNRNLI